MKVDIHYHVIEDFENITDDLQKIQIKRILKTSFYNVAEPSSKYPNLYIYKTNSKIEILFMKNKNSILVVSIKQK